MPHNGKTSFKKILVLGSQGQLGRAFQKLLSTEKCISATRQEVDLSDPEASVKFLEWVQPDLVLNAAAYTQVDRAETEPTIACLVNSETPGRLADWCATNHVPFVHFSTDYVFSGEGTLPWKENDPTSPINIYGESKAAGEKQILSAGGMHLIFRTSWVYDTQGKNFLNTILRLAKEREILRIVDDQVGAPTLAEDLAKGSWDALQHALSQRNFPSGIYHLCNQGETTWYQFAKAITEKATHHGVQLKLKKLEPILTSEFPTPAARPHNSRLDTHKVFNQLNVRLPEWRESLNRALNQSMDNGGSKENTLQRSSNESRLS